MWFCFIDLELILRMDERVCGLLEKFETKDEGDTSFLDVIHDIIGKRIKPKLNPRVLLIYRCNL